MPTKIFSEELRWQEEIADSVESGVPYVWRILVMRIRAVLMLGLMLLSFITVVLMPSVFGGERVAVSQTVLMASEQEPVSPPQAEAERLFQQGMQQYQQGNRSFARF
ncbi:hypothetical protein Q2T42_19930 [Leptolyngbya boryana CZ1]|uniref:Uncharacterized protein n=1 Tax=Leptolyngbya boryana CZ1 TaxID=3060204 RepID=A0AA96WR59_LEPBY|nr:hypothetical protein [Leptolyngbya boryana]WNZ44102.1 hypothetical protein Q2T42_19930 [Leptolyngbya boryana CZ1]